MRTGAMISSGSMPCTQKLATTPKSGSHQPTARLGRQEARPRAPRQADTTVSDLELTHLKASTAALLAAVPPPDGPVRAPCDTRRSRDHGRRPFTPGFDDVSIPLPSWRDSGGHTEVATCTAWEPSA